MTLFSKRYFVFVVIIIVAIFSQTSPILAVYYPDMVYAPKIEIFPGVTWQTATNANPTWSIQIIEVEMTNRNVEVVPVFKSAGNVSGSSNERTSSMATRSDGIAAINGGYYNTTTYMTNSYTEIDGFYIGGGESNRSVLGFSGNHQAIAKRTKLSSSFVPDDPTDWEKIVDAMGGRGHFVTADGVLIVQDNEGTTSSHYGLRNPRTAIGYTTNPYKSYLVTVDGRQDGFSVGMTYTELAQLMADLGIEQSISLDGGGSTTAWIKGEGIVNSPSGGSERSVVNAWVVIPANTMDNTTEEVTIAGIWNPDTTHPEKYYLDHLVTDNTVGSATVTWTPILGQNGCYKVYAWWTADASRATDVPYQIVHAEGTSTVYVNQTTNGGKWNMLGTYNFKAGSKGFCTLINTAIGTVSADAIRFVWVNTYTPPPTAVEYWFYCE